MLRSTSFLHGIGTQDEKIKLHRTPWNSNEGLRSLFFCSIYQSANNEHARGGLLIKKCNCRRAPPVRKRNSIMPAFSRTLAVISQDCLQFDCLKIIIDSLLLFSSCLLPSTTPFSSVIRTQQNTSDFFPYQQTS